MKSATLWAFVQLQSKVLASGGITERRQKAQRNYARWSIGVCVLSPPIPAPPSRYNPHPAGPHALRLLISRAAASDQRNPPRAAVFLGGYGRFAAVMAEVFATPQVVDWFFYNNFF